MSVDSTSRELWHLDPACTFLNHGSFGACPRVVLAEQSRIREEMERQPVKFMVADTPPGIRRIAGLLGEFVGAQQDDIVFVDNATTAVNAVLRSFPLSAGDEVLTTNHVYPAVQRTLEYICGRAGARLIVAHVPFPIAGPAQVLQAVDDAMTDRTRLAILDHITSPTALIYPVRELVKLCRSRGARVMIDGAHAPGMLPLELDGLGADYYTGNCHKWLFAPKGCAFLHVAREHQSEVHPTVISHGFGQGFLTEFDWVGTKDPSPWLALPVAIEFWREIGGDELQVHNHALAVAAGQLLAASWSTSPCAPTEMLPAMVTVRAPTSRPATIDGALDWNRELREQHAVEVPVVPFADVLWIRVSAQAYNRIEEYQRLADAVLATV